ncbi:hypothetical protein [Dactylosporangium sp. CS-033363]|uniref:hypothetical protein n=1 Tax=Dactylosporangium sp. CS-033363 TaxID=3239935 RepID=UPI003D929A01
MDDDEDGADHVRRVLRDLGRSRVVELRETGAGSLLDVEFVPWRRPGRLDQ